MTRKTNIAIGIVAVAMIGVGLFFSYRSIDILNGSAFIGGVGANQRGILTGGECDNANDRLVAIMLSSDPEARPLSGIGQADIVFEMPVTPSGVTRMMAVFQCERPKEIGSVRSARLDFVPLALGLDTIYAHFGGEHAVLAELDAGVIDNIDGLKYDGTTYYRKSSIPKPHNAFTNFELLKKIIGDLNYKNTNTFAGYPHDPPSHKATEGFESVPSIYSDQFTVTWRYDAKSNSYFRSRDNRAEIDKNTNQQVSVKNVVVAQTTWSPISKDYLRIKTIGGGVATIYKNGQKIVGTWKKADDQAKLFFYDNKGIEIQFALGKIWVEFVTNF